MLADAVSVQLPMFVMLQLVEVAENPVPESVPVPATVNVVEILAACAPAPNIAARASPNMLVVFMYCLILLKETPLSSAVGLKAVSALSGV